MSTIVLPSAARRAQNRFVLGILIPLIVIVVLGAYNTVRGEPNVALGDVWRAVVDPQPVAVNQAGFLIRELRIPRVLLALLCGAALGLVGVLLQDSPRNPLADPGLPGIAQGASFAMALFAIYPEYLLNLARPLVCLIAGVMAGLAVIAFSGTIRDPVRMILLGAILSGFFAVLTTAVLILAPPPTTAPAGSGPVFALSPARSRRRNGVICAWWRRGWPLVSRQRCSLALAQETAILALDKLTTFLDIGHQLEVLELMRELDQQQGLTVLMVLHDLNHAASFSDQMVVLNHGQIVATGAPWSILQPALLHDVFGVTAL